MISDLFDLLSFLDKKKLYYVLSRTCDGSVLVTVTLVGMRIEIYWFKDKHIEYSIFRGNEDVSRNTDKLIELLENE